MSWFVPRLLAGLVAMALGGLAALLSGHGEAAVPGIFVGGGLAIAGLALFDRLHGYRLLAWVLILIYVLPLLVTVYSLS